MQLTSNKLEKQCQNVCLWLVMAWFLFKNCWAQISWSGPSCPDLELIGLGGWILAAVFYNLYQKANTEIQHGSKYTKCMPLPRANRIMNAFFLVMLLH